MTRNSADLTLPPRPGSLLDENAGSTLSENQHYGRAQGDSKSADWRRAVERARSIVGDLPQSAMFDETEDFIAELERLSEVIDTRLEAARNQLDG